MKLKEVSSGRVDCYFAKPSRNCLKSYEDGLVVCGLDKMYCYIPSDNRCYKMADMRTKGQLPGTCMDTCHGKLYIMIISGTELKRYDPLVNSWDPMEEHAEDTFCAERNSEILKFCFPTLTFNAPPPTTSKEKNPVYVA